MKRCDVMFLLIALTALVSVAALQAPGPWSWGFVWRDPASWYLKTWVIASRYLPAAGIGFGSMLLYQLVGRMVMYGSRWSAVFAASSVGIALIMIGLRYIAISPGVLPAYACGFGAGNALAARIYSVVISDRRLLGAPFPRIIWRKQGL
jgi:hypothetical protein